MFTRDALDHRPRPPQHPRMGRVTVTLRLTNLGDLLMSQRGLLPDDRVRRMDIEALVDTGATLVCLPPEAIATLGLARQQRRQARTANGVVEHWIHEPVHVELMDREADVGVMELPEGTPALLGYIPLELMDLVVSPKEQKVIGNPAHDGKMVFDLY